jgi:hypothetical protein
MDPWRTGAPRLGTNTARSRKGGDIGCRAAGAGTGNPAVLNRPGPTHAV